MAAARNAKAMEAMNISTNQLNRLNSTESLARGFKKNGDVEVIYANFFTQEVYLKWTLEDFAQIHDETVWSDQFETPFAPDFRWELLLYPDSGKVKNKSKYTGQVGVFLYKATGCGANVELSVSFDLHGKSLAFNHMFTDLSEQASDQGRGFFDAIRRKEIRDTFTLFIHMTFKNVDGRYSVPTGDFTVVKNYYEAINSDTADFDLVVDNRKIGVHAGVLKMNCDYFKRKIDISGLRMLVIREYDMHTMMTIVIFIYTKMVAFHNVKAATQVLRAAHEFLLFDLARLAADYVLPRITVHDALYILRVAEVTGIEVLKQSCFNLIVTELRNSKRKYKEIREFPGYQEFRNSETFDKLVDQLFTAMYQKQK
ncbi:hypothetical protein HDE_14249 [Halotydeus destructor]|nr:hypothetical protein HDE_14249 [Halotydeus destructor]